MNSRAVVCMLDQGPSARHIAGNTDALVWSIRLDQGLDTVLYQIKNNLLEQNGIDFHRDTVRAQDAENNIVWRAQKAQRRFKLFDKVIDVDTIQFQWSWLQYRPDAYKHLCSPVTLVQNILKQGLQGCG